MAAIKWDEVGARKIEAGIDRGVLYDPDGIGVAWNGLISVEEEGTNEVEAVYFDGLKGNDLVTIGDYSANMTAFTYPEEFQPFSGMEEDQRGIYLTAQEQGRFHLSYRTLIGSDTSHLGANYKIHLVYNLTANVATRNWETLALEVTPMEFEWHITAIPEDMDGHRPTAHIILDSSRMDPWLLEDLEDIIYGNADNDPTLPPLGSLITWIRKWNRLIIEDHGDGTWSAISQDDSVIDVHPDGYFEITADDDDVVVIDANTYTIKSSEKNDEDIYP
jgi:hypothetical protein